MTEEVMPSYYEPDSLSVRFYDLITSRDPRVSGDIEYYASFLLTSSQAVLELGCGTGRVASSLAARGFEVVAVDIAKAMLAEAEKKRARLPDEHRHKLLVVQGDMTTINLGRKFGLIICPYYAFNHLAGRVHRARALANMARHLAPDGHVIIHAASRKRFGASTRKPHRTSTFGFVDGRRLEVTWHDQDVDHGRREMRRLISYRLLDASGCEQQQSTETLVLRWFNDDELCSTARRTGLRHIATQSSFNSEQGDERIYVFEESKPTM